MPRRFSQWLREQRPPRIPPSEEESVLQRLLPMEHHPAVMLYGPTKVGKTRLAAWEGAVLAKTLGSRMVYIFSEPNVEDVDIENILGACAYHNVPCKLVVSSDLARIRRSIGDEKRVISLRLRKKGGFSQSVAENVPRVFVLDSIMGINKRLFTSLDTSELTRKGSGDVTARIYGFLDAVSVNLRTMVQAVNGYAIVVNHAAGTRDKEYGPGLRWKPRLSRTVQHEVDAEVFVGRPGDVPSKLLCGGGVSAGLVVADSRRSPDRVGYGCAIVFEETTTTARVSVEVEDEGTTQVYSVNWGGGRGEAAGEELEFGVLVPRVVCGPKRV